MKREPSQGSSNIRSVGYDKKESLLEVEFNNGGVYQYADVPAETFKEWKEIGFRGGFFHSRIRRLFEGVKQPPPEEKEGIKG